MSASDYSRKVSRDITKSLMQQYFNNVQKEQNSTYQYGKISADGNSATLPDGTTLDIVNRGRPGQYSPIYKTGAGQGMTDVEEQIFFTADGGIERYYICYTLPDQNIENSDILMYNPNTGISSVVFNTSRFNISNPDEYSLQCGFDRVSGSLFIILHRVIVNNYSNPQYLQSSYQAILVPVCGDTECGPGFQCCQEFVPYFYYEDLSYYNYSSVTISLEVAVLSNLREHDSIIEYTTERVYNSLILDNISSPESNPIAFSWDPRSSFSPDTTYSAINYSPLPYFIVGLIGMFTGTDGMYLEVPYISYAVQPESVILGSGIATFQDTQFCPPEPFINVCPETSVAVSVYQLPNTTLGDVYHPGSQTVKIKNKRVYVDDGIPILTSMVDRPSFLPFGSIPNLSKALLTDSSDSGHLSIFYSASETFGDYDLAMYGGGSVFLNHISVPYNSLPVGIGEGASPTDVIYVYRENFTDLPDPFFTLPSYPFRGGVQVVVHNSNGLAGILVYKLNTQNGMYNVYKSYTSPIVFGRVLDVLVINR